MPYLLIGVGLGLLAALALASSSRRVGWLLAAGLPLALAFVVLAWLLSPRSPEDAGNSCSDCTQWLGRFWEPGLLLILTAVNLVGWWAGVALGAAARRVLRLSLARSD